MEYVKVLIELAMYLMAMVGLIVVVGLIGMRIEESSERKKTKKAMETELVLREAEQVALRVVNNVTGWPISSVRELATDAHKRIDDTRRHIGKALVTVLGTLRKADADTAKALSAAMAIVDERLSLLEDTLIKKRWKC